MISPPRTPELYPIIPLHTPPPLIRGNIRRNTPDSDVNTEDTLIIQNPLLFDNDDDDEDVFDDFHFLHPPPSPIPLVRQNAMDGRDRHMLQRPQARAYEIHNYAGNIHAETVISTLEQIMRKSRIIYTHMPPDEIDQTMKQRLMHNFISGIQGNARYTTAAKENKIRDFSRIYDSKIGTFSFSEDLVETQMIGLSVDYVLNFQKSDILRQLYIDSFLTDCIEAYAVAPSADRYAGMSCTHGVIERLYTSVPEAIRQRLLQPNVGRYRMSEKQEKQYRSILDAYEIHQRILTEINAAVIGWFDTIDDAASIPESVTQRKRILTEHIVRHMNAQGFSDFNETSPDLTKYFSENAWLAISLSRNPPVLGGKKTRKAKSKKQRLTRKHKHKKGATRKARR